MADPLHIPDEWQSAIDLIVRDGAERVVVIGATDTGKSSFVRALRAADQGRALIDVDPGQKLVGPPGTISRSDGAFLFIGTTSAANVAHIARACERLSIDAGRFVANTSGFIAKLGARLQAATIAALGADLIVALGDEVEPILEKQGERQIVRLRPSPGAQRKTPSVRARLRQQAFAWALADAVKLDLPAADFDPAPPVAGEIGGNRPVCALADDDGRDMVLGILEAPDSVFAPPPPRPTSTVRLGSMWAEPAEHGWRLLETLHPSWVHDEPEG